MKGLRNPFTDSDSEKFCIHAIKISMPPKQCLRTVLGTMFWLITAWH